MACRKWLKEFLRQDVRPKLEPALRREIERAKGNDALQLVATGGAASILGRVEGKIEKFDRERIEATRLTFERLRHLSPPVLTVEGTTFPPIFGL